MKGLGARFIRSLRAARRRVGSGTILNPLPWPVALRGENSNHPRPAPLLNEAAPVAVHQARFVKTSLHQRKEKTSPYRETTTGTAARPTLPVYEWRPSLPKSNLVALWSQEGQFPFPSCGFLISSRQLGFSAQSEGKGAGGVGGQEPAGGPRDGKGGLPGSGRRAAASRPRAPGETGKVLVPSPVEIPLFFAGRASCMEDTV